MLFCLFVEEIYKHEGDRKSKNKMLFIGDIIKMRKKILAVARRMT